MKREITDEELDKLLRICIKQLWEENHMGLSEIPEYLLKQNEKESKKLINK